MDCLLGLAIAPHLARAVAVMEPIAKLFRRIPPVEEDLIDEGARFAEDEFHAPGGAEFDTRSGGAERIGVLVCVGGMARALRKPGFRS